jgi:hypothetical protein
MTPKGRGRPWVRSKAPHGHDLVRPTSGDWPTLPASQLPGKSDQAWTGLLAAIPRQRWGETSSELRMATTSPFPNRLPYPQTSIRSRHRHLVFSQCLAELTGNSRPAHSPVRRAASSERAGAARTSFNSAAYLERSDDGCLPRNGYDPARPSLTPWLSRAGVSNSIHDITQPSYFMIRATRSWQTYGLSQRPNQRLSTQNLCDGLTTWTDEQSLGRQACLEPSAHGRPPPS